MKHGCVALSGSSCPPSSKKRLALVRLVHGWSVMYMDSFINRMVNKDKILPSLQMLYFFVALCLRIRH